MKIVITDGYTLNPGDLSWAPLRSLGEVLYFDRSEPRDILKRCEGADIIVTNKTSLTRDVILNAGNLKMIAVTATGYNIIDVAAAKERNVIVSNVPEYGTYSVAQHTFALLLELSNQVGKHSESVRKGSWVKSIDWSYSLTPIIELKDKILGIVGLGRIGHQVAAIAHAFGMNIQFTGGKSHSGIAKEVTLDELFRTSDFVSLHCPVKADNKEFLNQSLLSKMKSSSFIINTARGQLINEKDLAEALRNESIAGAALDVLSVEPPPSDHPLLNLPNCVITPHNAWLSFEARSRILETTVRNIEAFISGSPIHVVR